VSIYPFGQRRKEPKTEKKPKNKIVKKFLESRIEELSKVKMK
jgi:hypothetical protein